MKRALGERYRVERELGSGGTAVVYLAQDLKHRRQVAIKVLKPELAAAVGPERFLREIETTANLRHPLILPLYDSGEADGVLFYVMPFVDGQSLRERLRGQKQLQLDEALRITREVAYALSYAHGGAYDEAMWWLRHGAERGFVNGRFVRQVDQMLAPLRGHPDMPGLLAYMDARAAGIARAVDADQGAAPLRSLAPEIRIERGTEE